MTTSETSDTAKCSPASNYKFDLEILNTWETEANYYALFLYVKITYDLSVKQFKMILSDN